MYQNQNIHLIRYSCVVFKQFTKFHSDDVRVRLIFVAYPSDYTDQSEYFLVDMLRCFLCSSLCERTWWNQT